MNMTKLKLILALVSLALSAALSYSQELTPPKRNGVSIGETKVSMGKNEIFIDYRILLGEDVRSCKVNAMMYLDGKPFRKAMEFSGDVGTITESGMKRIRYDFSGRKERLEGKDISFRLDVSDKRISGSSVDYNATGNEILDRVVEDGKSSDKMAIGTKGLISAQVSSLGSNATTISYGLMVGAIKNFGAYVRFQSNYEFEKEDFSVNSSGSIVGGGYIWPTGTSKIQTIRTTLGTIIRVHKICYPYAGFGYGYNKYFYEDISGGWGLVTDFSQIGAAFEAGVILKAGPMSISAGTGTIMFKTMSFDIGLGVMF